MTTSRKLEREKRNRNEWGTNAVVFKKKKKKALARLYQSYEEQRGCSQSKHETSPRFSAYFKIRMLVTAAWNLLVAQTVGQGR